MEDRHTEELRTMGDVEDLIEQHRKRLEGHVFLQHLEQSTDRAEFERLLPRLGFFAMAFQDMLRHAAERCQGGELKRIAEGMRRDDVGHDLWLLRDLERLNLPFTMDRAFSAESAEVRDVSYALIASIDRAQADTARLAILLALESAGHEFFMRVPDFATRVGVTERLAYFGRSHLEAEEAHEVFTDQEQAVLVKQPVAAEHAAEVSAAVSTTFAVMTKLAEHLTRAMTQVSSAA